MMNADLRLHNVQSVVASTPTDFPKSDQDCPAFRAQSLTITDGTESITIDLFFALTDVAMPVGELIGRGDVITVWRRDTEEAQP